MNEAAVTAVGIGAWKEYVVSLTRDLPWLRGVSEDFLLDSLLQFRLRKLKQYLQRAHGIQMRYNSIEYYHRTDILDMENMDSLFTLCKLTEQGTMAALYAQTVSSPPPFTQCCIYLREVITLQPVFYFLQLIVALGSCVPDPVDMKDHDSFDNTDTIAHLIFSKPECIREGFSYEDVFLETRISRGASISGLGNLLQTDVIMQATFNGMVCCPVAKTLFSKLRAHGLPIYVRSDKIADIFWDPLMPLTDTKEISFVFKSTYPYLASCRDMVRLVLSESKVTVHYYRIQSNKVSELRRDARFSATLSVACDAGDNNKFSKAPSNRLSLLRHEVCNAATSQEAAVLLAEHSEVLSLLTFKLTSMQANMVAKVVKVLSRPLLSSVGGVLLTQGGDPVLYSCIANNSHTVMTSKVSNERVRELSARSGVVVCPSTGSGKTLIGLVTLALLRAPDIPNLAVVPDLLVLHWKSEMTKHGFPTTGVRFFAKCADIKKHAALGAQLFVIGLGVARTRAWQALGLTHFHVTVVDEAQDYNTTTKSWAALFGPGAVLHDKVVALTATPQGKWADIRNTIGLNTLFDAFNVAHTRDSAFIRRHVLHGVRNDAEQLYHSDGTLVSRKRSRQNEDESVAAVGIFVDAVRLPPSQFLDEAHALLDQLATRDLRHSRRLTRILECICAGGDIHQPTIMALLRRLLIDTAAVTRNSAIVMDTTSPPPREAFQAPSDDCVICLCAFDQPVQLRACAHVVCYNCLVAMVEVGRRACPICRVDIRVRGVVVAYSQVCFPRGSSSSSSSSSSEEPPKATFFADPMNTQATFDALLENPNIAHVGEDDAVVVADVSQPKLEEVSRQLQAFRALELEGKAMVIFTKRTRTAQEYIALARAQQFTVAIAGHMGHTRRESAVAIQSFRNGEADVLVASYRFATGFDLWQTSHMLVTDVDLNTAKVVQALGRSQRVGRMHDTVYIKVLVFDGCFDAYLYETKDKAFAGLNQQNALAIERFCCSRFVDSRFGIYNRTMARVREWVKEHYDVPDLCAEILGVDVEAVEVSNVAIRFFDGRGDRWFIDIRRNIVCIEGKTYVSYPTPEQVLANVSVLDQFKNTAPLRS
jgi:superfamily II DNA or RNA helicase